MRDSYWVVAMRLRPVVENDKLYLLPDIGDRESMIWRSGIRLDQRDLEDLIRCAQHEFPDVVRRAL